jgi:hypothetical protein
MENDFHPGARRSARNSFWGSPKAMKALLCKLCGCSTQEEFDMTWYEEADVIVCREGYFIKQADADLFLVYDGERGDDEDEVIGEASTLEAAKAIAEKDRRKVEAYYENLAYERETGFYKPD